MAIKFDVSVEEGRGAGTHSSAASLLEGSVIQRRGSAGASGLKSDAQPLTEEEKTNEFVPLISLFLAIFSYYSPEKNAKMLSEKKEKAMLAILSVETPHQEPQKQSTLAQNQILALLLPQEMARKEFGDSVARKLPSLDQKQTLVQLPPFEGGEGQGMIVMKPHQLIPK